MAGRNLESGNRIPLALQEDIKYYLSLRDKSFDEKKLFNVEEVYALKEELPDFENNPAEMIKPTGWFRDDVEIANKKLFNNLVPTVSHPLSFIELNKYGFGNISESIITLGGADVVAANIGYSWKEPLLTIDESKRPVRTIESTMDTRGSLGLGTSRIEKLDAAAEIDMSAIKKRLQKNRDKPKRLVLNENLRNGKEHDIIGVGRYIEVDDSNYASIKDNIKKERLNKKAMMKKKKIKENEEELSLVKRLFTRSNVLAISMSTSLAFGRTTDDVASIFHFEHTTVTIVSVMAIFASLLTVVSSMKSEVTAQQQR